ncbi:MAG: substrate-binding domain-containing protein [Oscillospiraceae bacterium]|nr:substrate-binding domain-containing protein [Oscillospiraceae bacterium]
MKKLFAFILAVLILLTACSNEQTEETPISEPSTETSSALEEQEPELPEEPVYEGPEHLAYIREEFPVIDGSTSLIPLEAGIRAEIFGKTIAEATKDVNHSTTWGAFEKLLAGEVDMIFTCEMSEEQWNMADEAGIELAAVPVACEGFVFVVNADNPVDVLTQDQLRKIYSGEITNWKEVGGNDAEIIAYQRNYDSGSQNYMIEFMGDVPLMDAPTELRPGSMGGLMDSIAINDYAENSIGYSVYAYAADMYGSGDDIKFIKVDGAEVSKESMAAGEYPLMGYNYAVYDANEPENSPVRELVAWITSDEGQLAVARAGYVTVEDIGFDYSAEGFEKYQGVGTGAAKPENYKIPNYGYYYGSENDWDWARFIHVGIGEHEDGTKTYKLNNLLADKELENEINAFILENVKELEKYYDEYSAEIEKIGYTGEDWQQYRKGFAHPYYNAWVEDQKTAVIMKIKNGYISIAVTLPYHFAMQDGADLFYKTETAVWDMISGKRLSIEDMFYEGTDINAVLSKFMLEDGLDQGMTEFNVRHEMKTDFMGFTAEGDWHIDLDRIYFDYGNRYFYNGAGFDISQLWGIMVTEQPREMESCFTKNAKASLNDPDYTRTARYFTEPEYSTVREYFDEKDKYEELYGQYSYETLNEEVYPSAKKINATIRDYVGKYYTREAVLAFYEEYGLTDDEKAELFIWDGGYIRTIGSRYIVFNCGTYLHTVWHGSNFTSYTSVWYNEVPEVLVFDSETGELIDWKDILTEKGLEKAEKSLGIIDPPGGINIRKNGLSISRTDHADSIEYTGDEIKWD